MYGTAIKKQSRRTRENEAFEPTTKQVESATKRIRGMLQKYYGHYRFDGPVEKDVLTKLFRRNHSLGKTPVEEAKTVKTALTAMIASGELRIEEDTSGVRSLVSRMVAKRSGHVDKYKYATRRTRRGYRAA